MDAMDTEENNPQPTLNPQVEKYHQLNFDLQQLCNEAILRFQHFSNLHMQYNNLEAQPETEHDLTSAVESLLKLYDELCKEAEQHINFITTSAESKLLEIYHVGFTEYTRLLDTLNFCHSQRSSKFRNHVNQTIQQAIKLASFFSQVSATTSTYLVNNIGAIQFMATFSDHKTYENQFSAYLAQFQYLEIWTRNKFGFVMDCMPPSAVLRGRPRDISVCFTPSLLAAPPTEFPFCIKTYLVHEHTAANIQSTNSVPNEFDSVAEFQPLENGNKKKCRERVNHAALGKIFLDEHVDKKVHPNNKNDTSNDPVKKLRSSSNKIPHSEVDGHFVQHLYGLWQDNKTCYSFDRRLNVREKPCNGNFSATDKYCLIFVMDIMLNGEHRKLWTFSLPFTIFSHSDELNKYWLPMVWYDISANHQEDQLDLQGSGAGNWKKVAWAFNQICEEMTGRQLDQHHFVFLQRKAEKMIFNGNDTISDDKEILKEQFLASGLWKYFYGCLCSVRIGRPFNDLWIKRHVNGFDSFEVASQRLADAILQLQEKERKSKLGMFTVIFSNTLRGGLTFVFVKTHGQQILVAKFKPLDVLHKDLKNCSKAVVQHLNVKDAVTGNEEFKCLYPDNLDKRVVFKKFYDYAKRNPFTPVICWGEEGYETGEIQIANRRNWLYRIVGSVFMPKNKN